MPNTISSSAELIERTIESSNKHLNAIYGTVVHKNTDDLVAVEASGCYITSADGEKYFDCLSFMGVFNLGHRHPEVVEAVTRQLNRMPLTEVFFYHTPTMAELGETLAAMVPRKLTRTTFLNNSSHAVDAAMSCARIATGRKRFIACTGSFHGSTMGGLSVSGMAGLRTPVEPLLEADIIPYGDIEAFRKVATREHAAVIVEPVQAGLCRVPPQNYLPEMRAICDELGILLIDDETQTALGRVGTFFGCDLTGVVPDMMILGKGIGGGVCPLGLLLFTEEISSKLGFPWYYTVTSFAGNPLALVASKTMLDIIQRDKIPQHVTNVGGHFMRELEAIRAEFPEYVKHVCGIGLMITLAFHGAEPAAWVRTEMQKAHHILVAVTPDKDDPARPMNQMLLMPPLIVTRAEIDMVVGALRKSFTRMREVAPAKK